MTEKDMQRSEGSTPWMNNRKEGQWQWVAREYRSQDIQGKKKWRGKDYNSTMPINPV